MVDIAKCKGEKCKNNKTCYRYMTENYTYRKPFGYKDLKIQKIIDKDLFFN